MTRRSYIKAESAPGAVIRVWWRFAPEICVVENLTPLKVAWSGHVFSTVAESTVAEQSNSDGIKSELSEASTVANYDCPRHGLGELEGERYSRSDIGV